jgi:hypothetical protein
MTTRSMRLLGAVLLAVVLGSGVGVGIALDRLWLRPGAAAGKSQPRATRRDRDPRARADRLMRRFRAKLDLDEAQARTVRAAVLEMFTTTRKLRRQVHPAVEQARTQARDRIRAVLRPDQRARYEQLLKTYLERKAKRRTRRR